MNGYWNLDTCHKIRKISMNIFEDDICAVGNYYVSRSAPSNIWGSQKVWSWLGKYLL